MSLSQTFSRNIKGIRETRKLSVTEFAEELCIAKSSMQTILSGRCNVRMDTVDHIASQLNVEPAALLQESYTPNQFHNATLLLESVEAYRKLSSEDRKHADAMFHELVMMLDKADETQP